MNARRANIKEPVEVEDPKATEKAEETPEVDDEPETRKADEEDVPPVPEDAEPEVEYFDGTTPEGVEVSDHWTGEPEPQEWYPNQPCLNCGARRYQYTVGWGAACSECLNPAADEE